jgi:thiol-disulfide isomerase/thioredoxin
MKKTIALFLALASVLVLTGCGGGGLSKASESAFVSGDGTAVFIKPADRKAAPTVSGKTLTGTTFTVNKQKVAVINVWASWCSPCRAEAPIFQDFSVKNPDIQFVGILTRDNISAAQSFAGRFGLTYPTLVDDSILTSFRGTLIPNAIPTTLIIDAQGRVAARISGATSVALLKEILHKVSGAAINA